MAVREAPSATRLVCRPTHDPQAPVPVGSACSQGKDGRVRSVDGCLQGSLGSSSLQILVQAAAGRAACQQWCVCGWMGRPGGDGRTAPAACPGPTRLPMHPMNDTTVTSPTIQQPSRVSPASPGLPRPCHTRNQSGRSSFRDSR